jgi:hypothetical protein
MNLKKTGDGGGQCIPRWSKSFSLAWMHPGLEHSGNSQRIRFLFLKRTLDWKLPLTTTSIWNTLTWTTTSIWNIIEHSTHQQVAVRLSPPWLKSLTNLFLVRSEISCHIIVSCQKKCLFAVAQHNIFEVAPTSNDEDSRHILGEFNLQTIKKYQNASTCKERNHLNNTKLRNQQLSYSGASGSGTALCIKGCCVVSNCCGIVSFSGPGRVQNHR